MRWSRGTTAAAFIAALTSSFAAHAAPPAATSDTAVVNWRSAPATGNVVTCGPKGESVGCDVTETTIAGSYPCSSETIQAAGLQPALRYDDTYCSALVTGRLNGATIGGRCDISDLLGLAVTFASGVNDLVGGRFLPIGAIFTPTATSGTSITAGVLKVVDAATLEWSATGTGDIAAVYAVTFTTPLAADCRTGRGYLTPISTSTITIRN